MADVTINIRGQSDGSAERTLDNLSRPQTPNYNPLQRSDAVPTSPNQPLNPNLLPSTLTIANLMTQMRPLIQAQMPTDRREFNTALEKARQEQFGTLQEQVQNRWNQRRELLENELEDRNQHINENVQKRKDQARAMGFDPDEKGAKEALEKYRRGELNKLEKWFGDENESIDRREESELTDVNTKLVEVGRLLVESFRKGEFQPSGDSYMNQLRQERRQALFDVENAPDKDSAMLAQGRVHDIDTRLLEVQNAGMPKQGQVYDPTLAGIMGAQSFLGSASNFDLGGMMQGAGAMYAGFSGMGMQAAMKMNAYVAAAAMLARLGQRTVSNSMDDAEAIVPLAAMRGISDEFTFQQIRQQTGTDLDIMRNDARSVPGGLEMLTNKNVDVWTSGRGVAWGGLGKPYNYIHIPNNYGDSRYSGNLTFRDWQLEDKNYDPTSFWYKDSYNDFIKEHWDDIKKRYEGAKHFGQDDQLIGRDYTLLGLDRNQMIQRMIEHARTSNMSENLFDRTYDAVAIEKRTGLQDGTLTRMSMYDRYGESIASSTVKMIELLGEISRNGTDTGIALNDFTRVHEKLTIQQSVMERQKQYSERPSYEVANRTLAAFSTSGAVQDERVQQDIEKVQDIFLNPMNDRVRNLVFATVGQMFPETQGRPSLIKRKMEDPENWDKISVAMGRQITSIFGGTDTEIGALAWEQLLPNMPWARRDNIQRGLNSGQMADIMTGKTQLESGKMDYDQRVEQYRKDLETGAVSELRRNVDSLSEDASAVLRVLQNIDGKIPNMNTNKQAQPNGQAQPQ